ncbi:DUF5367 family protein [Winogradskyella algicola]|uniref:DUF5367 family protein n=1 Tax=Winogradskyella algicola TaxID=2575815 RepID=UPI001109A67F|nr:DUF5367 family protein [Winogradskyella algicola]
MKTKRAIVIGFIIWMIAIICYIVAGSIATTQQLKHLPGTVLFIVVMPLVWFGAKFYYKNDNKTHGYWVGQTMLLTAAALDALITVPVYIIPMGGSHYSFFTALEFWIIAFEFLAIATLYWYIRVYPKNATSKA